jgi:hypothetical protein
MTCRVAAEVLRGGGVPTGRGGAFFASQAGSPSGLCLRCYGLRATRRDARGLGIVFWAIPGLKAPLVEWLQVQVGIEYFLNFSIHHLFWLEKIKPNSLYDEKFLMSTAFQVCTGENPAMG